MPSPGPFAGRLGEAAYSSDGGTTYTSLERLRNPRFSGSGDTAETSSNDSGGWKEFINTWTAATFSFEYVADETAVGQEAMWTTWGVGTKLTWRFRPKGNVLTEKEIIQQGVITAYEQNGDRNSEATVSVTVQLSGAPIRQNQSAP